jgi:NADPH:quinone reductase-like Zn-dependent oxidoreductase
LKAAVFDKYGPPEVLVIKDVEKPVPKPNEILIKVHTTTVTAGDCEMRRFDLPAWIWLPLRLYMGVFRPRVKILGQELSGEIEAVGNLVTKFKPGEQVFAPTTMNFGAYAEYLCLPEKSPMALKPVTISFGEAATIPTGGLNALQFIKKARIQSGDRIIIVGAGGSIGTYAVQIAKTLGAEVTCIDSADKLEMLLSIGADKVIDYTREDFTKSGNTYDVIIEIAGKTSFLACIKSLEQHGRLIIGNPRISTMLGALATKITSSKKVINVLADYRVEDLEFLKHMIATGKIKPVIDTIYPLKQLKEAHRYVETGKKKGNLVVKVAAAT